MLRVNMLQQMLVISIFLSTMSCSFIQKTKHYFPCSNCLCFYSLVVNLVFGLLFSFSFTDISFPSNLWIGLFSFLGADTLYKTFEGKLSSYTDILNRKKSKQSD